ncbi:hypothetical protein K435DRAFT_649934 [Dendrothele bispora CBS 962.96]|uniref:Uncharacterized protein n=1 Tax=Dendrothele bispora (strain CBS 962.96) TaxID=1314807 RepID=A0A4S8MN99_DENBC|nr:hypothetical protein K435DRAFT_649934 [Dendrothele bispora CBS 962.96]
MSPSLTTGSTLHHVPSPVSSERTPVKSTSTPKSKPKSKDKGTKTKESKTHLKQTPSKREDPKPTPEPTGASSSDTTVHINDANDFSLLGPSRDKELVSEAESDGVSYCTDGSSRKDCSRHFDSGFIRAADMQQSPDGSWIQVTGCIDPSKFSVLDPADVGGQLDVRFPNGAQCTFGGYGSSFIELMEPAASRFCLRCCSSPDDQENCNSHHDRDGCPVAVPGKYAFPELGVDCS